MVLKPTAANQCMPEFWNQNHLALHLISGPTCGQAEQNALEDSLVIFLSTYSKENDAKNYAKNDAEKICLKRLFSASFSMPVTLNHTHPRVGVQVHPTPPKHVFFLLRCKRRCHASRSWSNEAEHPGSTTALVFMPDPLRVTTFTLQVIKSSCLLMLRATTRVISFSFLGFP